MIPFSFTIENLSDIFLLEKKIRHILQCESSFCSFLHSVPYKQLKFILQTKNFDKSIDSRMFRIPNSPFVLCLMDNNKTVVGVNVQDAATFDFNHVEREETDAVQEKKNKTSEEECFTEHKRKFSNSHEKHNFLEETLLKKRKI